MASLNTIEWLTWAGHTDVTIYVTLDHFSAPIQGSQNGKICPDITRSKSTHWKTQNFFIPQCVWIAGWGWRLAHSQWSDMRLGPRGVGGVFWYGSSAVKSREGTFEVYNSRMAFNMIYLDIIWKYLGLYYNYILDPLRNSKKRNMDYLAGKIRNGDNPRNGVFLALCAAITLGSSVLT